VNHESKAKVVAKDNDDLLPRREVGDDKLSLEKGRKREERVML
jgi:hypothetical protein